MIPLIENVKLTPLLKSLPRRDCPWLYQLPEEIRRAKDLNNREPLNREPNNLRSHTFFLTKKSLLGDKKEGVYHGIEQEKIY